MNKIVAVHTNKVLPYSETFIKNHIDSLQVYFPIIIGNDDISNGLDVSNHPSFMLKHAIFGKLQVIIHKLGFVSPSIYLFMKKNNVNILHSHFGQNGYASVSAAMKLKIPHVTTFHGFDISVEELKIKEIGLSHFVFRKNIQKLQKKGSLFIAVSNFIREKLLKLGFDEKKVVTHYLGIDVDFFKENKALIREKTVLCVARQVPYKGLTYLIKAFKKINSFDNQIKLKLIGDGPESEKLKSMASSLGINVEFMGRMTNAEVKCQMNKAMVYCQPSIKLENGHEEALALTIVEAQSMGLPAVVFNTGGMPEAINAGHSGYIVEPKNIQTLADEIIKLFKSKSMWSSFSEAAVFNARTFHNITIQTAKLEAMYSQLTRK
jgi:glycosyltransferase involved in cell wall biosynthesis